MLLIIKKLGTGEIGIHVKTVDEVPVFKTFLNLAKDPGNTILLVKILLLKYLR